MTSQLITGPGSVFPSNWEDSKATKEHQSADQFAAMLAGLCRTSLPEPIPAPQLRPGETVSRETAGMSPGAHPVKEPAPPQLVDYVETPLPPPVSPDPAYLVEANPDFDINCESVKPDPIFALAGNSQPTIEVAQTIGKEPPTPDIALPAVFAPGKPNDAELVTRQISTEAAQQVESEPATSEVELPTPSPVVRVPKPPVVQSGMEDPRTVEEDVPNADIHLPAVSLPKDMESAKKPVIQPPAEIGKPSTAEDGQHAVNLDQAIGKHVSLPKISLPPANPGDVPSNSDAAQTVPTNSGMLKGSTTAVTPTMKDVALDVASPGRAPFELNPAEQSPIPPTINPTADILLVRPTQLPKEKVLLTPRTPSILEGSPSAAAPLTRNAVTPEQVLQTEAAQRDANLVAGYLAESTRADGGPKAITNVKALLASSGFDLREDGKKESVFNPRLEFATIVSDSVPTAAASDLQSNAIGSSIRSQTISQIVVQAETLSGLQVRTLRLQLRPADLGQVNIQLSRDIHGRISAHITAERESAQQILSQSLDQLREGLLRSGLDVDKLHVQVDTGRRDEPHTSNPERHSSSGTNSEIINETESGGEPPVDAEKFLSLRA